MSLSHLATHPLGSRLRASSPSGTFRPAASHRGHAHFWERALSRRHVVQAAAGTAALALGGGFSVPRLARAAQADGATPKPIAGGFDPLGTGDLIHFVLPGTGVELSTIGDFRGAVGVTHVEGEGTVTTGGGGGGMSTPTATGDHLLFDADMRFMRGVYLGEDGQEHEGTFGFV